LLVEPCHGHSSPARGAAGRGVADPSTG
jgi:hypothetical protein